MAVKTQIGVNAKVVLELDESQARALDALVGYGDDAFLNVFYEKLGRHYMTPHENGLRRLFGQIRSVVPNALSRIDKAREALESLDKPN